MSETAKKEAKPNRAIRRYIARLEVRRERKTRRKLGLPIHVPLMCARCRNGFLGASRCQCKALLKRSEITA